MGRAMEFLEIEPWKSGQRCLGCCGKKRRADHFSHLVMVPFTMERASGQERWDGEAWLSNIQKKHLLADLEIEDPNVFFRGASTKKMVPLRYSPFSRITQVG